MKLHDFGLWFYCSDDARGNKWSTSIPQRSAYSIWYDGKYLGEQSESFLLKIIDHSSRIIKPKRHFSYDFFDNGYRIGHRLTLDEFDIIPNPLYES